MEQNNIQPRGGGDNLSIREALQVIALGKSYQRSKMANVGTGGVGTARFTHGFVAKVHNDPNDEEYEDYAGTIDVGEYINETGQTEPITHKGVMLAGIQDNSGGFLIVPTLYSDVTIITDAGTDYSYVVNYSHAELMQLDSHSETIIGATETEELDPEDNDSPDYDELEKTGNATSTKYTTKDIESVAKNKDGEKTSVKITPTSIAQSVGDDIKVLFDKTKIQHKVNDTSVTVTKNKVLLGDDAANQPLVLGNELADLMLDFLKECAQIKTPTLMGTMPALNCPNFTTLINKIEKFKSKTSFTK